MQTKFCYVKFAKLWYANENYVDFCWLKRNYVNLSYAKLNKLTKIMLIKDTLAKGDLGKILSVWVVLG